MKKIWWVGLAGLMVFHGGASAQSVCVENYKQIAVNLDQATKMLRHDQSTGAAGAASSAGGFIVCFARFPSLPTAVGCGLVFGGIALVSYYHYLPAYEQILRAEDAARIANVYSFVKFGTRPDNVNLEEALVSLSPWGVSAAFVGQQVVELMDSGALCDASGKPNISAPELASLIESKLN